MNAGPSSPKVWVWVHGYLGSRDIWHDALDELSKGHQVLAIDLPGFGSRTWETSPDSIAEFASSVLTELTQRGISSFGLMGHSMGEIGRAHV